MELSPALSARIEAIAAAKGMSVELLIGLALHGITTSTNREFSPASKITFGKYVGVPLGDVIENDPHYALWCLRNIDWFRMNGAASEALALSLDAAAEIGRK